MTTAFDATLIVTILSILETESPFEGEWPGLERHCNLLINTGPSRPVNCPLKSFDFQAC
jgi:hypothetical protein